YLVDSPGVFLGLMLCFFQDNSRHMFFGRTVVQAQYDYQDQGCPGKYVSGYSIGEALFPPIKLR
ncbi:hypothetical protein SMA90_26955, partial [Escherichia coli]